MRNDTEEAVAESVNDVGFGNHDHVLDFDKAFDLYYAASQRGWEHDRSATVGASEVWYCLKSVWYEKRGHEFGIVPAEDDNNWGAMERGNLIENHFVVPGLRLALPKLGTLPDGVELLMAGKDQKTIVLSKNSATPDGLIKGLTPGPLTIKGGGQEIHIEDIQSDCIVLEIKSIDPRATLLEERARHRGQTHVQLGLIREMTEWKPVYAIVLYIDASFINKVTPFVVEFDPEQYAIAKQRAADIYRIDDPLLIMPEGRFSGQCESCRWRVPCYGAVNAAIPAKSTTTADPEVIRVLDPLIQDLLTARKAYDDAERVVEVRKELVKQAMLDARVSKMVGPSWSVTWGTVKGRTRLDQKKLAEDIDLTPYMTEGMAGDQLRVTERLPEGVEKKPRKKKEA
jgi:hypothetical protein